MSNYSESYKSAGVDVTAGYQAVELIKKHIAKTKTPGVLSGIGGFGGVFQPDISGMKQPTLVSGTDGVGTKLKIAFLMDKHDTVGIDCVAMSVNDVVCGGAKPLFFLDYIACGKNIPERISEIVKGVAEGCIQSGCALIGGETAEMPGFYPEEEYDLAGFAVGIADKEQLLDANRMEEGDVLIGIASSGVHSNGFSLIRKILAPSKENINTYVPELSATLGEALLTPTKIYVKAALAAIEQAQVRAISHITGGGFFENIPRMLRPGYTAVIEKASFKVPPVFSLVQQKGAIAERDMFGTFNMGIGMCMAVSAVSADKALQAIEAAGERAMIIGQIKHGEEGVVLC